ncbi:MAG: diguanylate cyclase [Pseudomonadota bacterium]
MKWLLQRSAISVRLLKVVFGLYFSLTLVVTAIHIAVEYHHTRGSVADELVTIEKTFRESIATALWQLNQRQVEVIAEGIHDLPVIEGIGIEDAEGRPLVAMGDQSERSGSFFHEFNIHWEFNGEHIYLGTVRLYSGSSVVIDRVKVGFMMIALNAMIKSAALWLLFLWAFRRFLGRYMEKLSDQLSDIDLDRLHDRRIKLGVSGTNELSLLEERFNQMLQRIEEDKSKLLLSEKERRDWLEREVAARTRELEAANERLTYLATIDPLTEVNNRRSFFELGGKFFALARREDKPLSMLMLDLDLFKRINDSYGHALGDQVLRHFSARVAGLMRKSDLFARLGGEEFAVLLNDTDAKGGARLAEKIVTTINSSPLCSGRIEIHYSVSVGVAELEPEDMGLEDIYRRADEALYRAKEQGRNRFVVETERSEEQ